MELEQERFLHLESGNHPDNSTLDGKAAEKVSQPCVKINQYIDWTEKRTWITKF